MTTVFSFFHVIYFSWIKLTNLSSQIIVAHFQGRWLDSSFLSRLPVTYPFFVAYNGPTLACLLISSPSDKGQVYNPWFHETEFILVSALRRVFPTIIYRWLSDLHWSRGIPKELAINYMYHTESYIAIVIHFTLKLLTMKLLLGVDRNNILQ